MAAAELLERTADDELAQDLRLLAVAVDGDDAIVAELDAELFGERLFEVEVERVEPRTTAIDAAIELAVKAGQLSAGCGAIRERTIGNVVIDPVIAAVDAPARRKHD